MAKIHINNPKQVINGGAKKYYFKVKGLGGPKGDKGDTGATGPQGPQGPQGNAATVSIGSTTTLPVGYDATVTNSGSIYNAVLNFGIPQGPRGPQGATGAKGDKGDQGNTGPQGEKGTNATVTVGTTTTTEPGTQAYAWNSSSNPNNAVINFNIPRGATGATGATGPQGPTGPAGADGADGQDGQNFTPTIVETLPTTGDESNLYLTPKTHTTSTATGNPIEATITAQAGQLESFQLDGDTFQQSYTGKNLFNKNNYPVISAFFSQGTPTITASGINRMTYIPCSPNTTYTVQKTASSVFSVGYTTELPAVGVTTYNAKDAYRGGVNTITTGADAAYLVVRFLNTADDTATQEEMASSIQIETGSATSYEPYVGGQPSPNPDYPQQIQTVTGEQTVSITKALITTDTELENSRLNSAGNVTDDVSNRLCTSEYIQVEPNTTYLFDVADGAKQVQAYFVGYASTNDVGIGNYPNGANWANPPFSITTGSNCHYVKVGMRFSDDSDITPNDISEIELLATVTTYPISLGSIELCKLGTYQDYIYKDGEDWKIHKSVKKVAPTGEESYSFFAGMARFSVSGVETGQTAGIISTHFMREYANNIGKCYVSTGSLIAMGIPNVSTEAQAQAWVSTNRPEFYCELSAPTDTTITNTALIAQLEAIRTASLKNGTNTIANTATGTNLAGDMEIGYFGLNPTNRYDKFIWLNLNNNYEQIGG